MKTIPTIRAVGMVIGHDITEIVPGKFKGVAFKKGHVIREEDIEVLLRLGKENIFVMELNEDEVHEEDAAIFIGSSICGRGVHYTKPSEGKINIISKDRGLLKINRRLQEELNDIGEICLATIHGDVTIEKNELIGGFRVIPLMIKKDKLEKVTAILKDSPPLIYIKPFIPLKTVIIVTGSEVYKGLIEDKFGPIVEEKLKKFNSHVIMKKIVPDELSAIKKAILEAKAVGGEMIIVTGGMSVDPDDKTPGAIKETATELVAYGTPVLPGAMLMLAYHEETPIFGLPGCVMFSHTTAFDILLPRIFAKEKIFKKDISKLGHGGQCLKCEVCIYPKCHFGKC